MDRYIQSVSPLIVPPSVDSAAMDQNWNHDDVGRPLPSACCNGNSQNSIKNRNRHKLNKERGGARGGAGDGPCLIASLLVGEPSFSRMGAFLRATTSRSSLGTPTPSPPATMPSMKEMPVWQRSGLRSISALSSRKPTTRRRDS